MPILLYLCSQRYPSISFDPMLQKCRSVTVLGRCYVKFAGKLTTGLPQSSILLGLSAFWGSVVETISDGVKVNVMLGRSAFRSAQTLTRRS